MSVDRLERVNSLLKRVTAAPIFPVMPGDTVSTGLFTVTSIKRGKDLHNATVYVSVFGDDALKETALAHLRHHARRFQQIVNREVRMKFTPRLTFKLDLSLEQGDAVLALLDRLPGSGDGNGQPDNA